MSSLRIALINPIIDREVEYGVFKNFAKPVIPVGIGCLVAYARENGYRNIKIFDEQILSLDRPEVFKELVEFQPEIVGISCYTNLVSRMQYLASKIKKALPHTRIIVGSSHPSSEPDEVIRYDSIDFIIRGEGEAAFLQFLNSFQTGDFSKVPGLTYRNNGEVVHNHDSSPIKPLDQLPFFPYELFEKCGKYDMGKYMGSRGCPHRCTYCASRWTGREYRAHSPERVVDDVAFIVDKYNIEYFEFLDDNFNMLHARTIKICELMLERNIRLKWRCQTRADNLKLDVLKLMKKAGCHFITMGIESGTHRILGLMKKGITPEQYIEAVRLIKQAKINVGAGFILGFPTETREESLETIRFMKKLKLDWARFNVFVPYPGTESCEMVKKEGFRIDWNLVNPMAGLSDQKGLTYTPLGRTEEELLSLTNRYNLFFWASPKAIYKYLAGIISPYGMPHKVTVKELLLVSQFLWNYAVAHMKKVIRRKK